MPWSCFWDPIEKILWTGLMPTYRLGWSCSCSTQELRRGNLALVWTELMRNGSSKPKLLPWWCTAEAHRGDNHYKAGVQFFDYSPSLPTSWEREEQEGEEDDQEARGLACFPEASDWGKGTAAQQARAAMNTKCIPKRVEEHFIFSKGKRNIIVMLCVYVKLQSRLRLEVLSTLATRRFNWICFTIFWMGKL